MKEYKLFINGAWVDSISRKIKEVLSPSAGKAIATIQDGNEAG
jgi:acyl-CoA reductase-like NAD-dependent aldehyde dehydrogenase